MLHAKTAGLIKCTLFRPNNSFKFHRNICRKLNDFSRHRHCEDAISVQRIVEELRLECPSPVLFYKAQGVKDPKHPKLDEDTFLLILMTSFQAGLFELFSSKIVCLDSTHKTNQYRFKLITVVVPDEYHNGTTCQSHTFLCPVSILYLATLCNNSGVTVKPV